MPRSTPHTEETKRKIWLANRWIWVTFNCDYCWKLNKEKYSHFKKKKRHFCNRKCYSNFRKKMLPKEEQHAYRWWWMPDKEKHFRRQARRKLNYEVEMWRKKSFLVNAAEKKRFNDTITITINH